MKIFDEKKARAEMIRLLHMLEELVGDITEEQADEIVDGECDHEKDRITNVSFKIAAIERKRNNYCPKCGKKLNDG